MEKRVLAIFAHPDDAEFMCAGTLSLLKKLNWDIHIATFTPGDKGSATLPKEEISRIRRAEAARSAALLGGEYHCLGFDDVYILYDRDTINAATALVRKVRPGIVFTASPQDYMADHEMSAKIVQTACFAAGIKNMDIDEIPYGHVPHLYYCDPMEGTDIFGHEIHPSIIVDITTEAEVKEQMLACHASQREWLLKHHKMDEYILAMQRFAAFRGKDIGRPCAEGFRQHLGHGYPHDNVLKEILGGLAYQV